MEMPGIVRGSFEKNSDCLLFSDSGTSVVKQYLNIKQQKELD